MQRRGFRLVDRTRLSAWNWTESDASRRCSVVVSTAVVRTYLDWYPGSLRAAGGGACMEHLGKDGVILRAPA